MDAAVEMLNRAEKRDALFERAEALVPTLLERAARTDLERCIPAETVQDLHEAGLFRVGQPIEFGGFGMGRIDRMHISRTLARGCASTGWVHAVLSSHAGLISSFPQSVREEVWGGDGSSLVSSAVAPTGRIAAVAHGYRLDGRFPFSSGCDLAQWAVVGVRAPEEENAARLVLVPLGELSIIDDWQTLGLRATGSKTLEANGVFVPASRVLSAPRLDYTPSPLTLCAVAVGIADGAIDRFVDHTVGRVSPVTGLKASESEFIQALVAESTAEADAAWLLIEYNVRRFETLVAAGEEPSDLGKARMRRDQAYVGRLAMRAVDRLYSACGGSVIYDKTPLQRLFRDIHAATQHPSMSWEVAAPQAGRVYLKSNYVSLF